LPLGETISTLTNLSGSWLEAGDVIEWRIPLDTTAQLDVRDALPGILLDVVVTGQIVARGRVVPEPGTMLLLGPGIAGLAALARRRERACVAAGTSAASMKPDASRSITRPRSFR
jgi:hypothetical protein